MLLYSHGKGTFVISATVDIRFWFRWWEHMLTSFKSKGGVLCGGSYTSPVLVLFGSIFDKIFDFIFSAFEPYHNVVPSTVQCPLPVFGTSFPMKGMFKVNSSSFKTESKVCLMKYFTEPVDIKVNHNLFKVCVSRNFFRCVGQY